MNFNITAVTILIGNGADHVMLMTDLPCATWPFHGFQSFDFKCAAGTGLSYVQRHIGIEPTVIKT